ncbi:MAG: TRAP transporter small permease [Oscillibacter sp.]|nr:TRAP transporter small permease [Oscillibacter sp.]
MLKAYSKFLDVIETVQKAILAVSVPVMVFIMMYQVVLRYVFSNSNAWSEELTRYLFIFNVMFASAIAVRRNSHLQIDILINLLKPKVKCIFTIVATVIGIVFLGLLFKYCLDLCVQAARNISPGVGISMSVPYAAMPIGIVFMILTSIEVVIKNVEELGKKEAAKE